jgi:hypothetical protein
MHRSPWRPSTAFPAVAIIATKFAVDISARVLGVPSVSRTNVSPFRRRHNLLRQAVGAVVSVYWLVGCVYYVDSIIPEGNRHFNPDLVGTWMSADSAQVVIASGEDSTYQLEYREARGEPVLLYGRVGLLGENTILEVWPGYVKANDSWPVGRVLAFVDISNESIKVRYFEIDSIRAVVKREGAALQHMALGYDIILTAAMPGLAANLEDYSRSSGFLTDVEVWHRQQRN